MAYKKSGIALLMLIVLSACGKTPNYLPDLPVNFSAPLTDPRLNRLSSPGGAVTIDGYGIAGIIIYRKGYNEYVAFDRCSTVDPNNKCAVIVDNPSITATDPCSGARFSLLDGSPVKAPAKTSLKRYEVLLAGNTLHVTN